MDKPVNVKWQLIFTIIGVFVPFVWLYPFNKIHKIIRMILIRLLVVGVTAIPMVIYFGLAYITNTEPNEDYALVFLMPLMLSYSIGGVINIPFIIKWSRTWNHDLYIKGRCEECKCGIGGNCLECHCHKGKELT
jgi:putative lipase involved disintegration of autophagic bodies